MKIIINGQHADTNSATILALLSELKLNPRTTVVEKNGCILNMALYARETINENDELELIRYVGGG